MAVEAELHRRDGAGNLVDWVLVDDADASTGKADPVIDAGMRAATSSSHLYRLLNQAIPNGNEMRLDLGTTDQYLAYAADGTATTAASWTVLRIYLTSGAPTRMRIRTGVAWDSRTVGWT